MDEERLTYDELMTYKDALHKSMQAATNAEKAIAESKAAQSDAKYIVLSIYMKHNLKLGVDDINENGVIIRKQEEVKEDNNE